jgi:hypothetical protein
LQFDGRHCSARRLSPAEDSIMLTVTPPRGRPLHFEHLVQINDPRDPRVSPLSREQLWRGLLLRAQAPELFIPWLDDSQIQWEQDGTATRALRFGDYCVRDRVFFTPRECVVYAVTGDSQEESFSLTMRIEEPAPKELFVRFVYAAHSEHHHAESPVGDLVKAAYREADEDTVFRIRQFAAVGALEEGANDPRQRARRRSADRLA